MRILHVITSLRTGGAEKLMVDLLPKLAKSKELEVDLLVFDGERTPFLEQLEGGGVKVSWLGKECSVYNPLFILKLIPILKRYDIVHTHNTACQFFVAIANMVVHTKIVTTEHSTSNRRRQYRFLKMFDGWMYRQYQTIITVSDIAGQNIKDYIGNPSLPVKTVANGIDVNKFYTAEPCQEIIEKYNGCYRAVMVAGFRYEKDQKTVIRAYKHLPEKYHLFLVGDGEKRTECEELAQSLCLRDRIHFLGIRVDVPNILKAMDVVIMSSHREGLSLSNLEGMASGMPFIASDVEGLHEIVDGYGILFPHEVPESLSESIMRCCEDRDFAYQIEKKCYARALEFDIDRMAKEYSQVYESLYLG